MSDVKTREENRKAVNFRLPLITIRNLGREARLGKTTRTNVVVEALGMYFKWKQKRRDKVSTARRERGR